jgi:hypothetical protein
MRGGQKARKNLIEYLSNSSVNRIIGVAGRFGADEIVREIAGSIRSSPSLPGNRAPSEGTTSPKTGAPAGATQKPAALLLPPIDEVKVTVTAAVNAVIIRPARGGGSGTGGWAVPTALGVERDRVIGERGEELVYRLELARLRAAGHSNPENQVVWTSRCDPGADHDIISLATDGKPLWIEVKSTMRADGSVVRAAYFRV